MANPSLQIGNSNWAIKEDNLLGYSTAGTRFVPQPITMTRASAGTRVNSSGLVETVELLGSELVTNGSFTTDTDWTKGSNWTISGGSATSDGTDATSNLYQTVVDFTNKTFLVEGFASNVTQGFVYVSLGGSDLQIVVNSNGSFKHYVTISTANSTLFISARNNFIGSIDNISVKEVTKNNLARVDYDGTASSLLVEPERTNLIQYSEDFSQWTDTGVQVNINSTISPSGTQNASTITGSTASSRHNVVVSTISGSVSASFSVFAKAKELRYLQIASANSTNQYANFDLLSGTIGTIGGGFSNVKIESLDNDWYKISLVSNSQYNSIYLSLASSLTASWLETYSMANNSDSLYLWGGQVEEASYATSYIPTDGSTVTRVQDQYSKTGISNLINSEEGVLFVEMAFSDAGRLAILNSDASDDQVVLGFSGTVFCRIRENGANVVTQFVSSANQLNTYYKIAVKYKSGSSAIWVDGNETVVAGTFTLNDLSKILFISEGSRTYGKVKQLQIYKTTDIDLAALTS
jgi:hypothetical protein